MIKYYRTMDHQIHEISEPMEGTWISLIHPTAAELAKIATDYKIDIDDLRAPLDEEERSHIEVEEGYTLFGSTQKADRWHNVCCESAFQ